MNENPENKPTIPMFTQVFIDPQVSDFLPPDLKRLLEKQMRGGDGRPEKIQNEEEEEKYEPFIYDERIHITLEDAQEIIPGIQIGETIEEEVTPKDFGRVAAATAKQVIVQKIREAERNNIATEFGDKTDEMISVFEEIRISTMHTGATYLMITTKSFSDLNLNLMRS